MINSRWGLDKEALTRNKSPTDQSKCLFSEQCLQFDNKLVDSDLATAAKPYLH